MFGYDLLSKRSFELKRVGQDILFNPKDWSIFGIIIVWITKAIANQANPLNFSNPLEKWNLDYNP